MIDLGLSYPGYYPAVKELERLYAEDHEEYEKLGIDELDFINVQVLVHSEPTTKQ